MVHAGQAWTVTGLSKVVTAAGRRGQGLGRSLVRAARAAMELGGADLALFTGGESAVGFFVRAGFDVLPGKVLVGGPRRTRCAAMPSTR